MKDADLVSPSGLQSFPTQQGPFSFFFYGGFLEDDVGFSAGAASDGTVGF